MDTSRRAVESYWRSRMIDTATSDEDKVTPVYKLEEICELLRSSHVSIVKEISGFVLKRLEHKSPIVKQKALRLIKYAVGKSGVEFRREMQRHSVSVRQLFHYKGQPDPLKGDALNKSVRDTAQEAIAAIFSEEDSKPAPAEDLNRRIQGFGNANYEIPIEDKKSFLSGVVGLGSASIKHGLSNFTQGNSFKKTEGSSYRGPNLQRSLTTEIDNTDRYEPVEYDNEKKSSYGISKNLDGGSWVQDSMTTKMENSNGESSSRNSGSKNSEERLLETIVTTGGVRLQPTRDAIQVFLVEAAKLNAVALSLAIASKLQSPLWQVRLKAVCILESILRKKDYVHFSVVESYFTENADVILQCSESPQSSLRDRTQKVLTLLGGDQVGRTSGHAVKPDKAATTAVQLPDLIDTGDFDGHLEDSTRVQNNQTTANLTLSSMPLIDDLFGDSNINGNSTNESKTDDDPFADVSFHTGESGEHHDDLFKGMSLDDSASHASDAQKVVSNQRPEVFDIFGLSSEFPVDQGNHNNGIHDLMANLSVNENQPKPAQQGTSFGTLSQTVISGSNTNQTHQVSSDINNILGSESVASNGNTAFPMGPMLYSMPPGFSLGQAIPPQMANFGVMGNLFAQQQFLATMANFQHLGNFSSQHAGGGHPTGDKEGGNFSPLPDIFNPNIPSQASSGMLSTPKKEETKAFDFISDHVAAARDSKRAA